MTLEKGAIFGGILISFFCLFLFQSNKHTLKCLHGKSNSRSPRAHLSSSPFPLEAERLAANMPNDYSLAGEPGWSVGPT